MGTRRFRAIGTSEGQDPVHRDPDCAFAQLRFGEGLLWSEPPVDVCNETRRTGTSTRLPPRPPLDRRAPRGARDPLAFAPRSPGRVSPAERAVRDAPRAARSKRCAPTGHPRFRADSPRCSHGPTVLKRRARSRFMGILRAPLLRGQPSTPSSPTRCRGGLERLRRASRGPSRQVSLAERGRVRHHESVEISVPAPPREGRRIPEDQGAFHRSSPRGVEGRPSAVRVGLCVTPPALDGLGHCESPDQRLFCCGPSASP